MSGWPNFLIILVAGYLSMTRAFAYLGFPPAKLFIGELAIAAFLISRPREVFDRWAIAMQQPSTFGAFALAFACFLIYGLFEVAHGMIIGYPVILALQGFAFHYYPICFFIGFWAGRHDPTMLRRIIRFVAWTNGIYGLLFIVFLNRIPLAVPGTSDVLLFGQPAGCAVVVLGLLCVEPKPGRFWYLILLNLLVMLGLQVRAEFLGFIVGLLIWATLSRRFDRLLAGCAAITLILIVGLVTDFRMEAPSTRGGEISTAAIVSRVVAPFDLELAQQLAPDAESRAGTAQWRVNWWHAIWDTVHESTLTALVGEGYGYPIAELVGYKERDIRTPHSVFFYALCYGGWVGVVLFFAMQLALAQVLWYAWRVSGNPFGLVFWATVCIGAFFGNSFETPFAAIPFYVMTGAAASPLLLEVRYHASPVRTQLLSTARG